MFVLAGLVCQRCIGVLTVIVATSHQNLRKCSLGDSTESLCLDALRAAPHNFRGQPFGFEVSHE